MGLFGDQTEHRGVMSESGSQISLPARMEVLHNYVSRRESRVAAIIPFISLRYTQRRFMSVGKNIGAAKLSKQKKHQSRVHAAATRPTM
jgi:hypothetical protein